MSTTTTPQTDECPVCGANSDANAPASYCSSLCYSVDSGDGWSFGMDADARILLKEIRANPEADNTTRLITLYIGHGLSPDHIAQHTPYCDTSIRQRLRDAGVYRSGFGPGTEPLVRARLAGLDRLDGGGRQ